jgi:hypothetical protein
MRKQSAVRPRIRYKNFLGHKNRGRDGCSGSHPVANRLLSSRANHLKSSERHDRQYQFRCVFHIASRTTS